MSETKDIPMISPKVKKYYDGWAHQNSKDKVTWEEAWRSQSRSPTSDVVPYVADEAEFEKRKELVKDIDIHSTPPRVYDLLMEKNPVDLMSMAAGGDAGFPLDKMKEYDAEFKKMCEDMMKALPSEHKIMEGSLDIEYNNQETE